MSKTTKNQKPNATEAKTIAIPHVVLTERYAQAVSYASIIHATDTRKGTNISYLSHLLGVSSLVIEAGGSENEAIAGLLHDAVEDAGGLPRLEDVRVRFGKKVAEIVLACSDCTDEKWEKTVAYWPRKQAHLDHLEATKNERAVLVSIADKVHNARAIVTDLERSGHKVLTKFNGSPEEILKYYAECLRIGQLKSVPDTLTIPLGLAVESIREYVKAN